MKSTECRFLAIAAASFVAVLGAFAAVVVAALAGPSPAFVNYREFLLSNVPGPRIVFDGGSNVSYSIDAGMIERHFKLPTIVVADHAGVPLGVKVTRLEHYLRQGDTAILPLEWPYYVRDYIEPVLAQHSSWIFRHYLDAMPLGERLQFALTNTRPTDAVLNLLQMMQGRRMTIAERVADFQRRAETNPHGGFDQRPEKDFVGLTGWTCAQYVFLKRSAVVPDVAVAAKRLGALQKSKGVRIVLTWPSVTGNGCYDDKAAVDKLSREVRRIFEAEGITVLASPERSHFPGDEHRYDTYYHLTAEAAAVRTRRLIEDLDAQRLIAAQPRPGVRTPDIVKGLLSGAARDAASQQVTR